MNDQGILKISFLVSTFGLLLLFYVSANLLPPLMKIADIEYDNTGSKVMVKGEITSFKSSEKGHIFLKVSDGTGEISVVLFKNLVEKLDEEKIKDIKKGNAIEIAGTVEEYRGSLEIVPGAVDDVK
jgi:DNA/RNA endonuclease YhcR with UshA esterase domain